MSYAIIKEPNVHLGFVLFASPMELGHCVFQALPTKPEHFELDEYKHLHDLKLMGELSWINESEVIIIKDSDETEVARISAGKMYTANFVLNVSKLGD